MFYRQISDFEENFRFLDRLNAIVFNVWKDDNAEAFKTQSMEQFEMFYRNYINEMRQKSSRMKALEEEINELLDELRQVGQETQLLTVEPEIQGYGLAYAAGKISIGTSGGEYFVMRKNEDPNDAKDYAFSRCGKLQEIEDACYERPP